MSFTEQYGSDAVLITWSSAHDLRPQQAQVMSRWSSTDKLSFQEDSHMIESWWALSRADQIMSILVSICNTWPTQ